jgi:uncharacterized protein with PCYCGC motif
MPFMGRKSSAKENRVAPDGSRPSGGDKKKGPGALVLIALMVIAVGAGAYMIWGGDQGDASASATAAQANGGKPDPAEMARNEAFARKMAALGPHKQASYPPIPSQEFAPPRPVQTVNAAFMFAAEHPEVASYIPCFCGCQQGGHRGNEDCFVKTRDANGDVVEWEPHGLECAVCIDVATRARQMTASGASVTQIREAVEKEFKPNFPTETPTPLPPASH